MNTHFQPTPHLRCPECGHSLHFAGRGRHECTNPQCTVIYVTVNRVGKQHRIVTQGPATFTGPNPIRAMNQGGVKV